MKVFTREMPDSAKKPDTFILILDKREARTLVEIAEAAYKANKRRSTFRTWHKKLEELLVCW